MEVTLTINEVGDEKLMEALKGLRPRARAARMRELMRLGLQVREGTLTPELTACAHERADGAMEDSAQEEIPNFGGMVN
jgi:hypothetical protein